MRVIRKVKVTRKTKVIKAKDIKIKKSSKINDFKNNLKI